MFCCISCPSYFTTKEQHDIHARESHSLGSAAVQGVESKISELEELKRKCARMKSALEDIEDMTYDGMDTVDGSNGQPAPNLEMRINTRAQYGLGKY